MKNEITNITKLRATANIYIYTLCLQNINSWNNWCIILYVKKRLIKFLLMVYRNYYEIFDIIMIKHSIKEQV